MSFEEIFREMEALHRRMTEEMFREFEAFEDMIKSGELEGEWRFEPIERPGVKGFIARGFISTPRPLERPTNILPPLRPKLKGPREPLYDVSVNKDQLQVFIELPGVEEEGIHLEADDGKLKVEAGDFQTEIDLSSWVLDTEKINTEYRNGVLKVIFPRTELDEQLI
ncbi:MAG: Hsp20/alpha crystallin family protein [Candidatus Bathyarchaeota archaeon]|jgi:HSP20 family molecular chaperone IbpA|nr:Hsp20/alpha crystallin family protein [Candidatus Bathyarchaeota archaeon]